MVGLIADIGATNARFAIALDGEHDVTDVEVLQCADHANFADAAQAYLELVSPETKPTTCALAIAGPVDGGDHVSMTNHPWSFSISEAKNRLGWKEFQVINDFTAVALGVPLLTEKHIKQVGNGQAIEGAPVGIIGPGTGLGVAGLVFHEDKAVPIPTEGGHVTMHATNDREFAIIKYLLETKYSHVSAERLISGRGLVNIYQAISAIDDVVLPDRDGAAISEEAMNKTCKTCAESLNLFCGMLGSVAGNLALSLGAHGGIYIAGGIVPQLGEYFDHSRFRERFLAKGRYHEYLDNIPTFVIEHPFIAFLGLKSLVK